MSYTAPMTLLDLEMLAILADGEREESETQLKYHAKGILRLQVSLAENLPNGEFKFFYPEGQVAIEGQFKNGRRWGETTYYHPDGSILETRKE